MSTLQKGCQGIAEGHVYDPDSQPTVQIYRKDQAFADTFGAASLQVKA
jgi:hypothetical protein